MNINQIATIDELESIYAKPLPTSVAKELSSLNELYKKLIAASPFVSVASIGPDGMDCSPRGDGAGFVHVLDDKTLAIPDRRGNNRLDTLRNIVEDPRVALLFMIPGYNETLRVNGQAYITNDQDLLNRFEVDGKKPATVIVAHIEKVYFQCARAIKRSNLWDASNHVDASNLPSAGSLIQSAIKDFDAEAYDAELSVRQKNTLY